MTFVIPWPSLPKGYAPPSLTQKVSANSRQLCVGQITGIEAAAHRMRSLFSRDNTDAVLLVDVMNAFSSLNRQVALGNIQHFCPSLANILINTYRVPTELFADRKVLWSEEGTTQGDPLTMPMYALATIPLIDQLGGIQDITQVWYADNASAAGNLPSIRTWWDRIRSLGPAFGYHANACKMWLIAKEQHLSKAKTQMLRSCHEADSTSIPLLAQTSSQRNL